MNNFYWLVKREFWEHRGSFLWTPIIVAAIVLGFLILGLGTAWFHGSGLFSADSAMLQTLVNGSAEHRQTAGTILDGMALVPMGIIFITLIITLASYCLRALHSDRQDRSILFWKSLPVSDLATVASKGFSALVVAPVIAVVVGTLAAILAYVLMAVILALHGIGFGQALWGLPHPLKLIVTLLGLLPIYAVWMLPGAAWLVLCSAWAKGRRVGAWAFGLPFGLAAILSWLLAMLGFKGAGWFWDHVALRTVTSIIPGGWLFNGDRSEALMADLKRGFDAGTGAMSGSGSDIVPFGNALQALGSQYHLLLTGDFLWGALIGLAFLALAVWLRRWRTEL